MKSFKDIVKLQKKRRKEILKKTCILYSEYKMGQYGSVPLLLSINLQTKLQIVTNVVSTMSA